MTLSLNLPNELAGVLTEEANRAGLPLSDYVLRILAGGVTPDTKVKTGADLVTYWQNEGLIGMRSDISDPQEHARQLRQRAERRSRE